MCNQMDPRPLAMDPLEKRTKGKKTLETEKREGKKKKKK